MFYVRVGSWQQAMEALHFAAFFSRFRSPGRGDVEFEDIMVALNDIGYAGPLSVEWEDIRMDRVHGGAEAASFVRSLDFPTSGVAFDAAFDKSSQ